MSSGTHRKHAGIDLFHIRGIQIRLDYSWFIVFVLVLWSLSAGYFPQAYPDQPMSLYWMAGLLAAVLFFLSVITHELSHSFMAIRSGIRIPEITLFIFGGMARLSEDARDPKTELKIAIVGPLTSFALAAVFWLIRSGLTGDQPSILVEIFGYLAWINAASDLPIRQLISNFFLHYGYRGFPVTANGKVLGVISLSNVKDMSEDERADKTVGEAMTPLQREMTVAPETSVEEAL